MDEPFTQERLVERYPGAPVKFGEKTRPIERALALEALVCPARPDDRKDELSRVGRLAVALHGAGSLREEDVHLLTLRRPEVQGQ